MNNLRLNGFEKPSNTPEYSAYKKRRTQLIRERQDRISELSITTLSSASINLENDSFLNSVGLTHAIKEKKYETFHSLLEEKSSLEQLFSDPLGGKLINEEEFRPYLELTLKHCSTIDPEIFFEQLVPSNLSYDHTQLWSQRARLLDLIFRHLSFNPNVVNRSKQPLLHAVIESNSLPLLESLLAHANLNQNVEDKHGLSALQFAACRSRFAIIEILLKKGFDPNHISSSKIPPLHIAADRGSLKKVELFLKFNASLHGRNGNHRLAYFYAALNKGYVGDLLKLLKPEKLPITAEIICAFHKQGRVRFATELYPTVNSLAKQLFKEVHARKMLGHSFELKGTLNVMTRGEQKSLYRVDLEGLSFDRPFLHQLIKHLKKLKEEQRIQLSESTYEALMSAAAFSLKSAETTNQEYCQRIQEGKTTLVYSGYRGHAVQILFDKYLAICNRHTKIQIFKYNRSLVTEKIISKLRNKPFHAQSYHKLIETLKIVLELKMDGETKALEYANPHDIQIVGNCVKASFDDAIWAIMACHEEVHRAASLISKVNFYGQLMLSRSYVFSHLQPQQQIMPDMLLCRNAECKLSSLSNEFPEFVTEYQEFKEKMDELKKLNFSFIPWLKTEESETAINMKFLRQHYYS